MPSQESPNEVIARRIEQANGVATRSILALQGFEPDPPELLDDLQLRGRLWELIYAMAAHRIYLACTDHLSDRELHQWLHENWLNEAAADVPPQEEWNARISPVSSASEHEGTALWLRYYADEEERQQFCDALVPPHETPQHDRDRFLPDAPLPPRSMCGSGCEDGADESLPFGDTDDEDDDNDDDDEDDESIIEDWQQPLKVLQRQGVALLPPDEHTDETIGAGVWELLHELACRGFYVLHTDHLTDRALYVALWKDSLREPALLPGRCRTAAWYHDFTGSGSDADEHLYLRYYASDDQRAKARRENPRKKLPPKETPVARRDWRLPKGPF